MEKINEEKIKKMCTFHINTEPKYDYFPHSFHRSSKVYDLQPDFEPENA